MDSEFRQKYRLRDNLDRDLSAHEDLTPQKLRQRHLLHEAQTINKSYADIRKSPHLQESGLSFVNQSVENIHDFKGPRRSLLH